MSNDTKMVFTDKDIEIMLALSKCPASPETEFRELKIQALLARLAAAEQCLELPHMVHTEASDGMECTFCSRYKAWLRACGKSNDR